jgi:hypothetical protein
MGILRGERGWLDGPRCPANGMPIEFGSMQIFERLRALVIVWCCPGTCLLADIGRSTSSTQVASAKKMAYALTAGQVCVA